MPDSFFNKLEKKWDEGKFLCIGLDPDLSKIAVEKPRLAEDSIFTFNKSIINSTAKLVCAYKINSAFYEAYGAEGINALIKTAKYIKEVADQKGDRLNIPIILDAKRADIESTNEGYVKMAFEIIGADAITVHPYLGYKAMKPFLERKDKGIFVLVKTSNEGSDEFQGEFYPFKPKPGGAFSGRKLYEIVADNVSNKNTWNYNGNCGVVVGATFPNELKQVRSIMKENGEELPILVPGIGAQGGDLEAVIKNGLNSNKQGLIINSSRAIIYSDDPGKAAEDLDKQIRSLI